MTLSPALVPQGISHSPDLSAMPQADRIKHHTRQLYTIALHQGIEGVKAYQARHSEAAAIRIHSSPVPYVPKPKGYAAELSKLVAHWFESETALSQTNKDDVARLNDRLGSSFNVSNHFSKPLSSSALRRIAAEFEARGAKLCTRSVRTMSDVRKAVRSSRATGGSSAVPMGVWGSRDGDRLTVGDTTFAIETHNGNDCIRLSFDGTRVRIRLDALSEFLSMTGMKPSGVSNQLPRSGMRELAPDAQTAAESDPLQAYLPEKRPRTDDEACTLPIGETVPDARAPSLFDRIRRLPKAHPRAPAIPDGQDPLALI